MESVRVRRSSGSSSPFSASERVAQQSAARFIGYGRGGAEEMTERMMRAFVRENEFFENWRKRVPELGVEDDHGFAVFVERRVTLIRNRLTEDGYGEIAGASRQAGDCARSGEGECDSEGDQPEHCLHHR